MFCSTVSRIALFMQNTVFRFCRVELIAIGVVFSYVKMREQEDDVDTRTVRTGNEMLRNGVERVQAWRRLSTNCCCKT